LFTFLSTTNPTITFNGTASQKYRYTNTTLLNFAPNLDGTNGNVIILFDNGGNTILSGMLRSNPSLHYRGGSSNSIATNGAQLTLTSYGTNYVAAYLDEP